MKLYKTTFNPISNFATTLKGDTLFGQICWAIRYTFGNEKLESLLSNYESSPFLIVSDGFAKGYLPKPSLPSNLLDENSDLKKENRKRIWLKIEELQNSQFSKARKNEDVEYFNNTISVVKNSLNYKTFMTDESGKFSPYSEEEISMSPKDVYFLIDDTFSFDELNQVIRTLSLMGYGKNASIGKGFFEFSDLKEITLENNSKTFMTLSPSVLIEQNIKTTFYEPFTRFGKHSSGLNTNPFKKPLLMANTSAIIVFEEIQNKSFIGRAIKGHSSFENTVHQGYSIIIPIKGLDL
jgi:CRISPR-associated protein Csm4